MKLKNNNATGITIVGSLVGVVIFLVMAWILFPMKTMTVGAGQLAVAVEKPYFFGNKGVRPVAVTPGRWWEWKTTDYIMVKNTPLHGTVCGVGIVSFLFVQRLNHVDCF